VAWPGAYRAGAAKVGLAQLYAERFGDFDGSKHLAWEEAFFPTFLDWE
jgi:hypothetical protein